MLLCNFWTSGTYRTDDDVEDADENETELAGDKMAGDELPKLVAGKTLDDMEHGRISWWCGERRARTGDIKSC